MVRRVWMISHDRRCVQGCDLSLSIWYTKQTPLEAVKWAYYSDQAMGTRLPLLSWSGDMFWLLTEKWTSRKQAKNVRLPEKCFRIRKPASGGCITRYCAHCDARGTLEIMLFVRFNEGHDGRYDGRHWM